MMAASPLHDIAQRIGGDVFAGGTRANVPGPGHSRSDRSLSLLLTPEGRVVWKSFADDPAEAVWTHLGLEKRPTGTPQDRQAWERMKRDRARRTLADRRRKLAFCEAVWTETQDANGSPVEVYLRGRRGLLTAIPAVVRFHPAAPLDYERRATTPAMVALVQGPSDNPAGLHVTALKPDGSDKAGENCRRMFGDIAGGAVRLSPVSTEGALAVGEGLETSMAFSALHGIPTWAALSTAGLGRFLPPIGVQRLTIAADSDDRGAGLQAAEALATTCRRRCATAIAPAPAGQDWADVLLEAAHG